jgi:Flp pilus assembly protein TadD
VLAAYAGTLGAPFIFDDIPAVLQNPSLHRLGDAWWPPPDLSVSGRPLVNFTLALNFATAGTAVYGYHGLNLALHLVSCWLVFGLLRRAASRLGMRDTANSFAGVVAALWALHPIATGTVTYVMQRSELLVSCGALLAVYASLRALEMEHHAASRVRWRVVAIIATVSAMLAKEVAVVIPILVALMDRLLDGAKSWREILSRRRTYYCALAATWLVLAGLLGFMSGRGASAGAGSGVSSVDYAVSQLAALATYLSLLIWPYPLVFDRGSSLIPFGPATAIGILLLAVLTSVIAVTWRTRPLVATALAWFLLLLAPSSSVVPIATQIVAEHRAYLALLGPITLLMALGLRLLGSKRVVLVGAAGALSLSTLTLARNRDYATLESIWADTARKAPGNARAHFNQGLALEIDGRTEAALTAYSACLHVDPRYLQAHAHIARIQQRAGQHEAARSHFEAALAIKPDADLHNAAAVSLVLLNEPAEAIRHFEASLRIRADQPLVHYNLGLLLQRLRRFDQALLHLETAIQLNPSDQDARDAAARLRAFLPP